MPSEMTSIPERLFSCTLRSISAKRYGGIRPSRWAPADLVVLNAVEDSGHRVGLDLEPFDARVAPPPAHLPARVPTIRCRHHVGQIFQRDLTADVGHRLGVADAGEHGGIGRHPGVERRPGLGDETALDLRAAALGESPIDDVEPGYQADPDDGPGRRFALAELA